MATQPVSPESRDGIVSQTRKLSSNKVRRASSWIKGTVGSRQSTPGHQRIRNLANELGMKSSLASGAVRCFTAAVNLQFNRGRRTEYIVASCLYLQSRLAKDKYMLIDFSELQRVSIFTALRR